MGISRLAPKSLPFYFFPYIQLEHFAITLSIFINCFLFQYRSNASSYSLLKLSCGIFFSTTVLATIFPSSIFLLYSSESITIDLITNSSLIGVDLVVDTELKSLSVSSCRDVLLVAILDE